MNIIRISKKRKTSINSYSPLTIASPKAFWVKERVCEWTSKNETRQNLNKRYLPDEIRRAIKKITAGNKRPAGHIFLMTEFASFQTTIGFYYWILWKMWHTYPKVWVCETTVFVCLYFLTSSWRSLSKHSMNYVESLS